MRTYIVEIIKTREISQTARKFLKKNLKNVSTRRLNCFITFFYLYDVSRTFTSPSGMCFFSPQRFSRRVYKRQLNFTRAFDCVRTQIAQNATRTEIFRRKVCDASHQRAKNVSLYDRHFNKTKKTKKKINYLVSFSAHIYKTRYTARML